MNESGLPPGILDQQYWTRNGGAQDLPEALKESRKWELGLSVVNQHLGELEKRVMLVQDREADILAFSRPDALMVVGFYALHWRIERFHYSLK